MEDQKEPVLGVLAEAGRRRRLVVARIGMERLEIDEGDLLACSASTKELQGGRAGQVEVTVVYLLKPENTSGWVEDE